MSFQDDEVQAVSAVLKAISGLAPDGQRKVLEFVARGCGVAVGNPSSNGSVSRIQVEDATPHIAPKQPPIKTSKGKKRSAPRVTSEDDQINIDVAALVNYVKHSPHYEKIKSEIFKKAAMPPKLLVPLYAFKESGMGGPGLTTGEVVKFYKQFGKTFLTTNVARAIRGQAQEFVLTDDIRKKGATIRYRLSLPGEEAFEKLVTG